MLEVRCEYYLTVDPTCIGNFVGPLLFREQDAPNYVFGFVCVVISSGIAAALALVYRCLCVRHNTSRDKAGTTEGFHQLVTLSLLAILNWMLLMKAALSAFDNKLTDLKVCRALRLIYPL